MIDTIYVGCSLPLWAVTNAAANNNILVIDQNPLYWKEAEIPVLTASIFDLSTITDGLTKYPYADSIIIVPVADYAIPTALLIHEVIGQETLDYSFLISKKKTLSKAQQYGINCVRVVDFKDLKRTTDYIRNLDDGHDSATTTLIRGAEAVVTSSNQIFTEYINGALLNVDLKFDPDGRSQIVDIYRRFNDKYFRTVVTKSNHQNTNQFKAIIKQVKLIEKMMSGYHGQLTIDFVYARERAYVIEISPFFHKPWLTLLRKNIDCNIYEYTYYKDQNHNINTMTKSTEAIYNFQNKSDLNTRIQTSIFRRPK
ncbi:ATP-grasp domain-containing protein [Planktomarina temperata]|nr:ATP-grasp domain-containing protein [Planktomarina temperata]